VICWSLLKCPCHCTIPIGYRLFSWSPLRSRISIFAIDLWKSSIDKLLCLNFLCGWLIAVFLLPICVYIIRVFFVIMLSD
jgi:hypothetical protein